MNKQFKIGTAFGTTLSIHISWLWVLPLVVFTLVRLGIEPLPQAIVTAALLFGSVLAAELARIWMAHRYELQWREATLFALGATVRRRYRSRPSQESRIALSGLLVSAMLAGLFGLLSLALPAGALDVEMQLVAYFNLGLLLFGLLLRLTPYHDNLLHAVLARALSQPWPRTVMTALHSLALIAFAVAGIFMLGIGWLAFVWWFTAALLLSQLTTVAEQSGEYRDEIELAASSDSQRSSIVERAVP